MGSGQVAGAGSGAAVPLSEPELDLARHRARTGSHRPGLIIACGAVVREVRTVLNANNIASFDIRAVPATFHNRPDRIAPAVDRLIRAAKPHYRFIFVAFADCGTGGDLDKVIARHGVERLPGAHCYAFFTGVELFAAEEQSSFTTFYLTDFLARHFEALVWRGLGLDTHPDLRDAYFANYTHVAYISQSPTAESLAQARAAASKLGLEFTHKHVGFGDFEITLVDYAERYD